MNAIFVPPTHAGFAAVQIYLVFSMSERAPYTELVPAAQGMCSAAEGRCDPAGAKPAAQVGIIGDRSNLHNGFSLTSGG